MTKDNTRYINGVDTMKIEPVDIEEYAGELMEGREHINRIIKQIAPLQKELNAARDIVAEYSNDVTASIHTNERRIHARETVRRVDFARELIALAKRELEQSLEWNNEITPITKPKRKANRQL